MFMKNYATASVEVSHKAFQNLPMNTEAPPVVVPAKGASKGTKVRQLDTGVGYRDSFVTHPIPGNYLSVFTQLEADRESKRRAMAEGPEYPNLLAVIENGYRNLGRSADEQTQNSIRDRLRQAGASDEEIEVIMKEARLKKLREMSTQKEEQEQAMIRHLLKLPVASKMVSPDRAARPAPATDANVYNFGTVPVLSAALDNRVAEPGNEIFQGRAQAGVNQVGLPEGMRARFTMRRPPPLPEGPAAVPQLRREAEEVRTAAPLPGVPRTMDFPGLFDIVDPRDTSRRLSVRRAEVTLAAAGGGAGEAVSVKILNKKKPGRK
jgi:hypothetical protein